MTPDLLFDAPDLPIHVPDDPAGRLDMRRQFYEAYGFGKIEEYGFGTSELQFLEWEVRRGVLHPGSGSPWWRAVNADLIRDAARAAALFQAKFDAPGSGAVKCWLVLSLQDRPI